MLAAGPQRSSSALDESPETAKAQSGAVELAEHRRNWDAGAGVLRLLGLDTQPE